MTQYETQMLQYIKQFGQLLTIINNRLLTIQEAISSFFTWFQEEFSIYFFPLLMIIIGLLVLKWIARW